MLPEEFYEVLAKCIFFIFAICLSCLKMVRASSIKTIEIHHPAVNHCLETISKK